MGRSNRQRRAAQRQRQRTGARPRAGRGNAREQPDVAALLSAAVDSWGHAPSVHDALMEHLVALAAGDEQVAAAATRRLDEGLEHVWRRGWAPADVVHITATRLTAAHRDTVRRAIVADGRRRATSGAPPHARWQEQLDALADGAIDGLVARPSADVRLLVPVVGLLLRLPAIPPVMPGPDDAVTVDPVTAGRMDQRVLARVRALLAKAESTEFDEEAEALTAKAQELITRHAIADALLHSAGHTAEPSIRRVPVDRPYPDAKAALLAAVAAANRCRAVHTPDLGWLTLFGYDVDLDAVELLGASLLAQATGAMARQGPRRAHDGRSTTRSFRRAFLFGFAARIGERLREAADREVRDEAEHARLLPVLAARDARVDDAVTASYGHLERRATSISNATGWTAGHAAADLADLAAHRRGVDGRAP